MNLDPMEHWHKEIPGTRWFRADLHLHTLDDPYVDLPSGIAGSRDDPDVLRAYAARFLNAAVNQGIEVLGLTPHTPSIRVGVSAAWTIVETWESGHPSGLVPSSFRKENSRRLPTTTMELSTSCFTSSLVVRPVSWRSGMSFWSWISNWRMRSCC